MGNPYVSGNPDRMEQFADPREGLYQMYMNNARVNPSGYRGSFNPLYYAAHQGALTQRLRDHKAGRPTDEPLRDVEHALLANEVRDYDPATPHGALMWLMLAGGAPMYNALKAGQYAVTDAYRGVTGQPPIDEFADGTSRPSWQSVKWGLRPFWAND